MRRLQTVLEEGRDDSEERWHDKNQCEDLDVRYVRGSGMIARWKLRITAYLTETQRVGTRGGVHREQSFRVDYEVDEEDELNTENTDEHGIDFFGWIAPMCPGSWGRRITDRKSLVW